MKIEEIRGLLGLAHRARGLAIGSREARQGMRRGEIGLILLANDGSPRDRERLSRVAEEEGTKAFTAGTALELGAVVGRGAVSVLGIRDRNLAAGVRRRLEKTGSEPAAGSGPMGGD
ncbi:MAG TPA: L7Ae/L30e/S12e/Gadd45 family ribosomal protein [bacterium]|nr:L7Ae/L30e/S12e/Gadd45 family ribosomal protein [bacterium]